MTMTHPGLPFAWWLTILIVVGLLSLWGLFVGLPPVPAKRVFALKRIPGMAGVLHFINRKPWFLLGLRLLIVALFLLAMVAGFAGTPIAERNLATLLTWNLWWAGLIVLVFFLGSAWCAVCPWDSLATWLVKRRWWRRAPADRSLNLVPPKYLRNIIPALLLFVGLTWLELGLGVTDRPYATALLALVMVMLALLTQLVFEKKAFCRYFCPVGRTIGFYAQLSPIELRAQNPSVCASCSTLDCYHGNSEIDPCPTQLVMGSLSQNTYCTSCGNCTQSCPHDNIQWQLRSAGSEAALYARPHWDEAWFMLCLLGLTGFHGITMLPLWEEWLRSTGQWLGDSGQLIWTFSLGLTMATLLPMLLFAGLVWFYKQASACQESLKRLINHFAFTAIPLAFAYHLAHNLNHLIRETAGLGQVFLNPLGTGTLPLSMMEKHQRHLHSLIEQQTLYLLQTGIMIAGCYLAVQVIRHRNQQLNLPGKRHSHWPLLLFVAAVTGWHVWLLAQPMSMRM